MKTAHLINVLAQDAPVRWQLSSRLAMAFAVGAVIAAVIFVFGVGLRPDISVAGHTVRVQFTPHAPGPSIALIMASEGPSFTAPDFIHEISASRRHGSRSSNHMRAQPASPRSRQQPNSRQ